MSNQNTKKINSHNGLTKQMRTLNDLNYDFVTKIINQHHLSLVNSDILDIGIGGGYLAQKIIKHYKDIRYVGVDIENHLSRDIHTKVRVIKADLNYLPELQKIIESKAQYHFIFIFDVLEHLIHFNHLLQNIHKIMKRNGFLIISIPIDVNLSARIKLLFEDNIFSDPFNSVYGHVNLLSIKRIERGFGNIKQLKIVESQKCGLGYGLYDKKFHLDLIAKIIPSLSSRIYICLQKS